MTDSEVMDIYIGLVPFLASVGGPACEIVIHDVTNPDCSLVAIGNNVSGRQIGNPMTDFARELHQKGIYSDKEFLVNYKGQTKDGEFISSTFFIKNEGRLIGMLCVNKQLSAVQELNNAFNILMEKFMLRIPEQSDVSENLDSPVTSLVTARIDEVIASTGIQPARMSRTEKIKVVQSLNDEGVLMMKGAVSEIADKLSVSVPTIYRYLNKSKCE